MVSTCSVISENSLTFCQTLFLIINQVDREIQTHLAITDKSLPALLGVRYKSISLQTVVTTSLTYMASSCTVLVASLTIFIGNNGKSGSKNEHKRVRAKTRLNHHKEKGAIRTDRALGSLYIITLLFPKPLKRNPQALVGLTHIHVV